MRAGETDFRTAGNEELAEVLWLLCGRRDLEEIESTLEGAVKVTFVRTEENERSRDELSRVF